MKANDRFGGVVLNIPQIKIDGLKQGLSPIKILATFSESPKHTGPRELASH